ncbi:MAG: glutamate synthase-related protein, partial [Candidatus Thalassarchaeaceae archaeon]|nr:glutamate synthase-related protein [Candidatus Thalassarchaeaceae archaeon]
MGKEWSKPSPKLLEKTHHLMHDGFHQRAFPDTKYDLPEALGDARWTDELIASTWYMAETGECPDHLNYKTGKSGGGFDKLVFKELPADQQLSTDADVDITLELNRRGDERHKRTIDVPWYGGGMSYGSVSVNVMMSRALNAKKWNTLMSTGEGGYPPELYECS